jgi:hypothetical protein
MAFLRATMTELTPSPLQTLGEIAAPKTRAWLKKTDSLFGAPRPWNAPEFYIAKFAWADLAAQETQVANRAREALMDWSGLYKFQDNEWILDAAVRTIASNLLLGNKEFTEWRNAVDTRPSLKLRALLWWHPEESRTEFRRRAEREAAAQIETYCTTIQQAEGHRYSMHGVIEEHARWVARIFAGHSQTQIARDLRVRSKDCSTNRVITAVKRFREMAGITLPIVGEIVGTRQDKISKNGRTTASLQSGLSAGARKA